ncbi:MAG: NADH-quinone oxidoreductase subunit NuoH [Pirellulaceae bacterium]
MIEVILKIAVLLAGLMTAAAYFVLLERRMAAWIQDRIGPNRVGIPLTKIRLFGLGQPLADGGKFILKEEYIPGHVDKRLFVVAPITVLVAALVAFAVIPFGSAIPWQGGKKIDLVVAPGVDVGMIFVFALSSIAVYGVILGGWASNNKYSFLGGLRSSAQLIAYELPLGLGILGVVMAAGSLDLSRIIAAQAREGWYALVQPLGFIVFAIAACAEAARLPFDLPECEQELVSGYHTEYSGIKLLLFLVAEFLHMITAAVLLVILFFGGWHFPLLTGSTYELTGWGFSGGYWIWLQALVRVGVLFFKIFLVILFFMLIRWSWPRFKYDQLMAFAWKVLLPLGLVNFVVIATLEQIKINWPDAAWLKWPFAILAWVACIVGWVAISMAGPVVADNKPRRPLGPLDLDSRPEGQA